MLNISEINGKCTGCGGCYAVCGANAIVFKINPNGFYEGFVDSQKCIRCGLCSKICAKMEDKAIPCSAKEVYAIQSKNSKVLNASTSGGAAYHLAKKYLEKKRSICIGRNVCRWLS